MVNKKRGQHKPQKSNKLSEKRSYVTPLQSSGETMEEDLEDDVIEEEDYEFYKNADRSLDFLAKLNDGFNE